MTFEKFDIKGKAIVPYISISPYARIAFNGPIRSKIETFKYVVLYYDSSANKIGFDFTNDEKEPGRRKIKMSGAGWAISAAAFFNHYGIRYKETQGYRINWDENEKLFVSNLNEPLKQ